MNDFALKAREAGATATILCDVTPEEAEEWIKVSGQNDLDTVFLAAPTSTDGRLDEVCAHTTGFVYAVSRTGVTGAADNLPPEAAGLVSRLRSRTNLPICVGFGISTPGQVAELCKVADGVVIGSWLVDFLEKHWNGGEGRGALVEAVKSLKAATVS